MLKILEHRGPDGQGTFFDRGLALGMQRLAILDIDHGHQPYRSEDGHIVAVYNGEIYNYPALQRELTQKGHRLKSRSDGEVIVHLYEEYGANFVQHLIGMFAIAIWDGRHQQLLLARDHVGQKPLYLLQGRRFWAFASEIKAFAALPGYVPQVNPQALPTYLAHRYVPAPDTLLEGVQKLEPGQIVTIRHDGSLRKRKYWTPDTTSPGANATGKSWSEQLDALLTEVVDSHVVADVPVGVFLSGGLDSSLLASLAGQARPDISAWSVHMPAPYKDYDELAWAQRVADFVHLPLHQVDVMPSITPERLHQLAYILDEPMADPTVLTLDRLVQEASNTHTVMISGEGADEIFAGYAGYGEVQSLAWLRRLPRFLRQWWVSHGYKGSGALKRASVPIQERYYGVGFTFYPSEIERILSGDVTGSVRSSEVARYWDTLDTESELQAMQGFDIRWFLPDDGLLKADRIGMHHQVEIRVPYCDYRVVDLALRMPLSLRRHGQQDKRVLRQVGARHLPKNVVYRTKRGFPTPLTRLMGGPLYDTAYDLLTDQKFRQRGWFNTDQVESLLGQLAEGSARAARMAYALIMLELWTQQMVDRVAIRIESRPMSLRSRHP